MIAQLLPALLAVVAEVDALANKVSPEVSPFYYFDIDLAQGFNNGGKTNWVSSPVSIKTALGLLLEGSAGETADEISQALHLSHNISIARNEMHEFQNILKKPLTKPGADVKIATRLFSRVQSPLQPNFNVEARKHFGAEAKEVDFSDPNKVSNDVNLWVSEQTNNFITEVIQPAYIQRDTQLLIVNVVYFKGEWKYGFDTRFTRNQYFETPSGKKKIKMMATVGMFKSGYAEGISSQIIELPYKNERYSMVIVLPDEKLKISRVISDLPYNAKIISFLDSLKAYETDLVLPKFSIAYNVDIIPILQKLQINDLFTDNADLSNLSKTKARVSKFIHQAKIEVNENGTIAGAATTVNIQLLSVSDKRKIVVNRPFLFFIRDVESGFLFDGQVVDPSVTEVIVERSLKSQANQPPVRYSPTINARG